MNTTVLLWVFGLGSLWDVVTTVFGGYSIVGTGGGQAIVTAVVVAVIILFLVGLTIPIWHRDKPVYQYMLKPLNVGAILFDLWTSWNGNQAFLWGGQAPEGIQFVFLAGLTLFMSACPILWYVAKNDGL